MLTEYLAAATLDERRRELARAMIAMEALALQEEAAYRNPRRWTGRLQARLSRARKATSAAGHSLSMME